MKQRNWIGTVVCAIAATLVVACSTPEPSLYQRLGGTPGIAAVMDDFVENVRVDPVINRRFAGADLPQVKQRLTELVCQASGGPCKYTGRSMKEIHRGMAITDGEFNTMVGDMNKTLDKFKLPPRERKDVIDLLGSLRGDIVGQ